MAWGNRVLTTTQEKIKNQVVDTVLADNVFATRMLSKAEKWSGEHIKYPVKYQKGNSGSSFSGYDTFSTAASDTRVNMLFYPKFYEINISLPLDEVSINEISETQIINLMKVECASRSQDMADEIGTMFMGDGTGNGSKDTEGLASLVDDGTTTSIIGSLSRTTYTTLNSTVTASGGTLTLAKLDTLYNAVTSGIHKPTVGITTEAIFAWYGQLLQPQERIAKDVSMMKGGLTGGTGFTGLYFKGFPILADEKCTSGVLFFLNEDFLHWIALPKMAMTEPVNFKAEIKGNNYSDVKGLGFHWSDWVKPINSYSIVSHVYLGGNLTCDNPNKQGKLTGILGV